METDSPPYDPPTYPRLQVLTLLSGSTKGRPPNIPVVTEALAPASELTDLQQAFTDIYVTNGGNARAAAIEAGYAEASASANASRMLRNPKIQNNILRMTLESLGMQAPRALMQVTTLMSSARSDYVRLQAAQDVLDRAGFRPPERVDHRIDQSMTVTFDIAPTQHVKKV